MSSTQSFYKQRKKPTYHIQYKQVDFFMFPMSLNATVMNVYLSVLSGEAVFLYISTISFAIS